MTRRRSVVSDPGSFSSTQKMVYLSNTGSISGFRMKAIAMKMRRNIQRRSSQSSSRPASEQGDETYTPIHVEQVPEKLSPNQQKAQALQSIFYHPMSILMVFFPLAVVAVFRKWSSSYIFWLNLLAMVPLAKYLGDATEELADAISNDALSGLLNATLGNAVEMIIAVQTLRKNLFSVVKATLLGSILSNLLLVLGSSFFLGGLTRSSTLAGKYHIIHSPLRGETGEYDARGYMTLEKEQLYTVKGALVNMVMHLLAIMTLALPTLFCAHNGDDQDMTLTISRCGALVIAHTYVAYLVFHLVTHKNMLALDEGNFEDEDNNGGEESGGLGVVLSVVLMLVITVLIGISSEFLVEAMGDVVEAAKLPADFIGVILLPLAGNACEHASALRFAMIDRPGLSIGIAVGSSTQIALLVVPFTVIVGWCMDKPMDLDFGDMNLTILFLSTLVVLAAVLDGRSHWLKGFLLCNAYGFIGVLYWVQKAAPLSLGESMRTV
eukprot:CAMPEP_0117526416 /NCGR_PEP_ID=MMETSP0784-20121206/36273_1 /TAXON_ID=39447 /ORGANISM="" /LENGTH=492 /DNA_ID=CAMNT_0005322641 /DNA_START=7 /DNA_END=1485 /DNA_ORIENTATION=-